MRDTISAPRDPEVAEPRLTQDVPKPPTRRRGLKLAGVLALVIAGGVAALGIISREHHEAALVKWTNQQAVPTVAVVSPVPETGTESLTLPGDIQAWYEAPIYARVSGYLRMWYKDIGAHVKAGDVLAVIETPDLDQQLAQAKADLGTAIANEKLAALTAKRWKALVATNSVSQQSADEKEGDAAAREAAVKAAEANVGRLEAMEGFKRIVAPFDGVVTARKTDIGALINAGGGTGPELFAVADVHQMRVYVRVPQAFSAQVKEGMQATLHLPQYPDRTFQAKVQTLSHAINPESRTVLVELVAANPDGVLWPGTFADVHFDLPGNPDILEVPTTALIFQEHGLQLAVLDAHNRVQLRSIRVGRNTGTEIEVLSGIKPGDRVIDSPPDSITAGELVSVAGGGQTDERVASDTDAANASAGK